MIYGTPKLVTDGLVLALDAANSLSYTSGSAIWKDLCTTNISGSLVNTPAYDRSNGGSILFNGSNNYVTVNRTLSTPITFCSYFKFTDLAKTYNTLINSYPHNTFAISINRNGVGDLNVFIGNGGGWQATIYNIATLAVNTWYHVTYVSTGSGSTLYINGNAVMTNATSPSGWGNKFYLGWIEIASGEYFKGNIATADIYNRALTQQEITQNYNSCRTRFGI